jgi:hypothetical protein
MVLGKVNTCYQFTGLESPSVALLYIAVAGGQNTHGYAHRFSQTLGIHPPGFDYDLMVICNGGSLAPQTVDVLSDHRPEYFVRTNNGWDVGGYIEAAHLNAKDYDIIVCLGESCYFHRPGWGALLLKCWRQYGDGMYGFFSSNAVRAHMNTTAFATTPALLRSYSSTVFSRQERYNFEHGPQSFWRRMDEQKLAARLVTWDGCWEPHDWRKPEGILFRGDQSNTLLRCNHWDRFHASTPHVKSEWSATADSPFK